LFAHFEDACLQIFFVDWNYTEHGYLIAYETTVHQPSERCDLVLHCNGSFVSIYQMSEARFLFYVAAGNGMAIDSRDNSVQRFSGVCANSEENRESD
jgi:hypothetical protein